MDKEALNDAWNLSLSKGFKGDKEDFSNLLQSDSEFFDLSFDTFKEEGFEGDKEAYSNLLDIQRTKKPRPKRAKKGQYSIGKRNILQQILHLQEKRNKNPNKNKHPQSVSARDLLNKEPEEGSDEPQQQTSELSGESGIKQDILNKYPALKNVYGQQGENLVIDADTNFKPFEIGYGGIEFYSPEQSEITYGEGYSYEHPSKGKYAVKYNPEKAGEQDIFLDLLHGMDADPEYKKLREEFKKQTLRDRGGDIEYFYNKDKKEGFAEDGKERWIDNYVDGLIRSELAVGSEDYAKEAFGNSKEMRAIASRLNDYLISQPSEENDEELGLLLNPNLATTSDGKYSVDVSGTILFPKDGGELKPTTFTELLQISGGNKDAAIRMFANRSETNKVAKSPSKERVEEMLKEPVPTQEEMQKEVDEEFAVKYSAGNLYEDYIGKNTTLDSLYNEINFLENLNTPPQEKIQELKAQAQQTAQEVKNSAEKITQPVLEKNIGKYINEDGTIKEEYMTESFYGIPQVDRDKIRKELSPDEFIVDENLRTKYLFDLSQELQDQHDVPQAKRTEETNKLFKEKYGKPFFELLAQFEEELDVRASEAFESKYGKALAQINNDYKTKINKANAEVELDVETYVSKLTTEYDNITNQFNDERDRISQQLETASEQEYNALLAESERLTKQYNKKVDAYIQQETDYRADVNAILNSLNEQYFSEAQQQTDVLNKEFSENFQVPTDLIDNYNSVYRTAVGKLFEESNREKKKAIQEETDIPLGRIATNTLSSLGGSLYAITKSMGGEFPELKRMEQYFQPSVDPIKGFKDLNLYNIQESAGQLVGSMTPSLLASIGTALATRNLSTTARMFTVGGARLVVESSDVSARAYQTALETTGSQAIAKNAANETIDSQLLLAPTYLISSLPFIGGLKRIANRPLRVVTGGLVEYGTEGGLQEFPQQIFEESIQKYGEFERAGEFATMEKFEEVMSNVIPAFVPGAVGSWNTDPAIKLKRAVDKNPELARQFIIDFTYKNGKEKAALMLATLRSNGKVDKSTVENLFTYVEGIDLNNSQEYTVVKARRDDLIAARENESDDIKRKVISKQISELETQLENILEGRETNVTQKTVAGINFFTTPQQEQQTDVLQDLSGVQEEIDKSATEETTEETTTETTTKERLDNRTKEQKDLFGDQHTDSRLPYGAAEISDITTTDKNGVTTATYVNPETNSVDAIISATSEGNFAGYTRVYENGKPTNMFSAKMQTSESGVFKNIITSAENTLPDNAEVVETTTISTGGLKSYNKSRLVEKVDEDGNVVTRPTKYSDATKESVKEKGEDAFERFKTTDKSAAEAEIAKIKEAYPGINAKIIEKKAPPRPPQPGKKDIKKTSNQYSISIDLPVLVKPAEMQKTTEAPLVTNESGEVVTVYRGGKSTSGVQYYTSDQKLAEGIGEAKGEGVQKATVRMANPWTPESLDVNNAPQWMQDWVRSQEEFTTVDEETLAAEEVPMEQALQEIKDMRLSFRSVDLWQSFVNEALKHHDGIIAFDPSEDMAADKKIYITKSPEQVIRQEDAIQERETAEVPVGEEARVSEEVDEEVREQAALEEEVAAAKQNLQDAWETWKEQQRTTGIAFDPRSSAEQDVALTRAVLDYLKAIGAKTIEDVKAAVKDLAGFSIKDEDARYLLNKAKQEKRDAAIKAEDVFIGVKNNILNNLLRAKKILFSARKFLPRGAFKYKEQKLASIAKNLNIVNQNVTDFNRAFKKYKGDKEQLIKDFDAFLRSEDPFTETSTLSTTLPDEFIEIANSMRNHIDGLSRELVDGGYVTEADAEKIRSNLGEYITRAYEVYTNKNWKNKVQEEVKQKARNFLRKQLRPQAEQYVENNPGENVEEILDNLVDQKMAELLDKDGASNFLTGSKLGAKDLSVLKQRTDIPFEIRALMGEYTDPMQSYAMTIQKLSALVANARFLNQVKENGMGVYFFEEKDPKRPKEFNTKIAPKGSDVMNPLNGLYTTPEIAEEFNNNLGNNKILDSFLFKGWMKGVSTIKWVKTIGSFATHMRNVLGNFGFLFMNGHYRIDKSREAFNLVKNDILKGKDKALRDKLNEYIEKGIIKQSAGVGEIRDMFKEANFDDALAERMSDRNLNKFDKAKRKLLQGKKFAEDLYQSEDDFFKIIAYENEKIRYSDAIFGKDNELTQEQEKEIDDKVVEIVKNTYPTYDRVPEIVQFIRRFPLVGNFVSFQAESYRTMFNSIAIAKEELKSDNPKIKKIGASRIAGAILYESIKDGILSYFGMAAGTGLSSILAYFRGDDEEEKDQDARKFVAPWSKNSDLIWLQASDGKVRFIDFSASDPHGGMRKVINTAVRADNPIDAFTSGLVEFFSPFVDEEILFKLAQEIVNNKSAYGGMVYNPEENIVDKSRDILNHFYKGFEPGTITSARRLVKASGEDKLGEEAIATFLGLRIYDVDVAEQFGYRTKDYTERLKNARKIYSDEFYDKESTREDRIEKYDEGKNAYKEIMQEISDDFSSAERLGADVNSLYDSLKKQRFSKIEIEQILRGKTTGFVKQATIDFQSEVDKSESLNDQQRAEIRKLLLNDKLAKAKRFVREILEGKQ